jgi:FHS family glucose/mannose:H+ symporter-like MFS transporter
MGSIPVHADEISQKRAASVAIFAAFVVAGVVTTLLGPILPILIGRWSLSDERAGLFFVCQFGTSMVGVVSLGALIPRWGYKATLAAGYAAIALGIAGLNSSGQIGGLIATSLLGFGLGLVLPASNLWVAEVAGTRRVAALSILNLTWGVGAIACSPLVLIAQARGAIPIFLYFVAGLALAAAVILCAVDLEPQSRKEEIAEVAEISTARATVIALGALFFLYVGAENSVGGWAAALAKRMGASPNNLWALAPMFFWGGLLTGRAIVPVIPLRKREKLLVTIGLSMGLAGSAALLAASTFWGVAACVGVTGLGFAAIYPVLITWMAKHFGERARTVGSLMFALAGLGGAVVPWVVGFVSTRFGSLQTGLLVPAASCVVMLGLLLLIPRRMAGGLRD